MNSEQRPIVGVGVVCLRDGAQGEEVLLVRRGRPPRAGEWSLPGGRLELGETLAACALRELYEETGVRAELLGLVDVVDGLFPAAHFVLIDFLAEWTAGEPRAGDDAAEARFVALDQALRLVSWSETRRVLLQAEEIRRRGDHWGPAATLL